MKRRKSEKDYWLKRTERFCSGAAARSRAKMLRNHEHVAHVLMERDGNGYAVSYSVAKWYFDEAEKARISV